MSQFDLFDDIHNRILGAGSYAEFKKRLSGSACQKCALKSSRTHIVVDRGNPGARIVVVGEGPGENEDLQGLAFVGRAGQLMDRLVREETGLDTNSDFLIINVVKCRPPGNRVPKTEEAQACMPFLNRQLDLVRPAVVLLLGATALKYFDASKTNFSMEQEAGKFFNLENRPGIQFMVLFHPAYLLYNRSKEPLFRRHLRDLKERLLKIPQLSTP